MTVTAPTSGYAVVRFDGQAYASTGDRLVLAASNTQEWEVDDGNIGFLGDDEPHPFSHSRVYSVSAGDNTFYAVAENYVDQGGNGIASIYATLTGEFFSEKY